MATPIFDNLDLTLNELQNFKVQGLGSDPGTLQTARAWFRTDTHRLKVYDGSAAQIVAWQSDSLSAFAVPTGDVAWGSHKITGLADPTNPQDGATKNYVDTVTPAVFLSSSWKQPVKTVATFNGTLSTAFAAGQVWNGYTLLLGDRILLMAQTTPSENGIYIVTAGAPTRDADAATGTQLVVGSKVMSLGSNGTANSIVWTYESGAFTAQVWTSRVYVGAGGYVVGSSTALTLNHGSAVAVGTGGAGHAFTSTGLSINRGTTVSAAIDLVAATTTAGGIAFGSNEYQVYRDATNSLTIGATTTKVTNLVVAGPADHGTQLIRFGATSGDVALKSIGAGTLGVRLGDDSAAGGISVAGFAASGAATVTGLLSANGGLAVSIGHSIDMGSNRVQNVATPTGANDAANKAYVDNSVQGLTAKAAVLAATQGTETFTIASGAVTQINGTTVDGQSPGIGDRLLVNGAPASTGVGSPNSSQPANGVYIVTGNTTNLTVVRAVDMDTWLEVPSAYVWVEKGSVAADTGWTVTADPGGTLGTTAITWVLFAAAGSIIAGNGLTKTGNAIDIGTSGDGSIQILTDGIQVAALGITNAKIANSTIDLTAKVTGLLPIANGGTNSSTAAGARTNLGAAGVQTFTITHDGSTTTFTLTHNLNNNQPVIGAWDDNAGVPGGTIVVKGNRNSANATNIVYPVALTTGTKHYVTICG